MTPTFLQIDKIAIALSVPPSKALHHLIQDRWHPWLVQKPRTRISIRIRAAKAPKAVIEKFRRDPPHGYDLIFPTIGSVAAIKAHRGELIGTVFASKRLNPTQFYYGAIELVLLSLMRQSNLFPLHGAGVAKNEEAILSLGDSGAGKSTLAALFLLEGFHPLSDDDIIVRLDRKLPRALGGENGIFVCPPALEKFRDLSSLKCLGWRLKGPYIKSLLSPPHPPDLSNGHRSAIVKKVLFPIVSRNSKSKIKKLTAKEAMLHFLAQKPADWPEYLDGPETIGQTFQLYDTLSRKADCYRVTLGRDRTGIRRIINHLANHG